MVALATMTFSSYVHMVTSNVLDDIKRTIRLASVSEQKKLMQAVADRYALYKYNLDDSSTDASIRSAPLFNTILQRITTERKSTILFVSEFLRRAKQLERQGLIAETTARRRSSAARVHRDRHRLCPLHEPPAQHRSGRCAASSSAGRRCVKSAAIFGNENAMAIDRHVAMVLFGTRTPTPAQVRKGQEVADQLAQRLGWDIRETWAAGQELYGERGKVVETYEQYLEQWRDELNEYSPQTGKEKAEAYKLLDDFMKELARLQAFRELVVAKLSEREKGRKG